jgi:5-deoxy-glucuronate isomerase
MDSSSKQQLLFRHLETKNDDFELDITPEKAGWKYSGLKVLNLDAGSKKTFKFPEYELCILPMKAKNTQVTIEGKEYTLEGRDDPFKEVSDFIYIPLGVEFEIYAPNGGKYAFPFSKCSKKFEVEYIKREKVKMEVVGAGQATRQRNNFCTPSSFTGCHKLCALEVFTPAGNWSSYPPHKHDTETEKEAEMEEIYYFLLDDPKGFAFHKTYTKDGSIDATETVRSGDVFLVPRGYHGPCVTPPGYNLYYLNVMAGPAEGRRMNFCDDPDYEWVRPSWDGEEKDKRLPMSKGGCQC